MYRNYVFDFYGTLADIRTDEESPKLWEKMSEIYRAMGAEYDSERLRHAFRRLERAEKIRAEKENAEKERAAQGSADQERAVQGSVDQERANQERMQGNVQDAGKDLRENAEPDLTRVFSMLYQEKGVPCDAAQAKLTAITFRALSREYIRVYDGVEVLLKELRRRGKGVFLLSNAQTDFTRPEIEMLGLTPYFDGIFLSSEQGCKKPSPLFFGSFLKTYKLNPAECIMIGNDESTDIAGAKRMGMATLYIHTAISPAEYGIVEADYRVMDGDFHKVGAMVLYGEGAAKA